MLCPKFMLDWKTFYIDLIQHASPVIIMQTLNRILITGRHRKDKTSVDISKRIVKKIENKFVLNFQAIAKFYHGTHLLTIENIENSNLSSNEAKEYLATDMNKLNIQGNSCIYII